MQQQNRRQFLQRVSFLPFFAGAGSLIAGLSSCNNAGSGNGTNTDSSSTAKENADLFFKLSLAEWSFHKALFANKITNLDFPLRAKNDFGFNAVEYVNQFFMDKANDKNYLAELKKRCNDNDITSVRIMCDGEGDMGDTNEAKRKQAVENHHKWVEAAQYLGCTDIRVNARGEGSPEQVKDAAVKSLSALCDFAKDYNIGVIVENHGGYSSDGAWITDVMKQVNRANCGLLPDWGNFCLKQDASGKCLQEYDRYKGVREMMPYAKGYSAKSYAFDAQGNETTIDFMKMLQIAKNANYHDYVGIEFEGPDDSISEEEGIRKTLALVKKDGIKLS